MGEKNEDCRIGNQREKRDNGHKVCWKSQVKRRGEMDKRKGKIVEKEGPDCGQRSLEQI